MKETRLVCVTREEVMRGNLFGIAQMLGGSHISLEANVTCRSLWFFRMPNGLDVPLSAIRLSLHSLLNPAPELCPEYDQFASEIDVRDAMEVANVMGTRSAGVEHGNFHEVS